MNLKRLNLAMALLIGSSGVFAQGNDLSSMLAASGIDASGYIQSSYTHYDVNKPAPLDAFNSGSASTFDIQQAAISVSKLPVEGVGGLLNIVSGSNADDIHAAPYTNNKNGFDLTQAYGQYRQGIWTVMAGKFISLNDAESIDATQNANISHSIAFFHATPLSLTGVRLVVQPLSTLSLYLGSNNGWNQQQANAVSKTTEVGLTWLPCSPVSWRASYYSGDYVPSQDGMGATSASPARRSVADTVINVAINQQFSVKLSADSARQDHAFTNGQDAQWSDVAGYATYHFTTQWAASLRYEDFNDQNGYRLGLGNGHTKSTTLSVAYDPLKNLQLRGELRQDKTPTTFDSGSGMKDTQNFAGLDAIYSF